MDEIFSLKHTFVSVNAFWKKKKKNRACNDVNLFAQFCIDNFNWF